MNLIPTLIKPLPNWCVVRTEQRDEKLVSGIIVPMETGAEKVREGSGVLACVRSGAREVTMGLHPGQRIVYRTYLKYVHSLPGKDGEKFCILNIDDILGVIGHGVSVGALSRPAMSAIEAGKFDEKPQK